MTLLFYTKKDDRILLCLSLDSGSQLETNLCPINITWLRLGFVGYNTLPHYEQSQSRNGLTRQILIRSTICGVR